MAVWQQTLELVPRSWFGNPGNTRARFLTARRAGHDQALWAANSVDASSLRSFVASFFAERAQLVEGIETFGIESGNRVDVATTNDLVEEVSVRIDARDPDLGVHIAAALAERLNCLLYSPEHEEFVDPTEAAVDRLFADSRAKRYLAAVAAGDESEFLEREATKTPAEDD